MIPLDNMLVRITQQDVVYRYYVKPGHRAYIPDFGVYIKHEQDGKTSLLRALSRQLVMFCVERRKAWRMLQSKAGIVNKEYQAQKAILAEVDAGKLPVEAKGDYHELDILVVGAGTTGRPRHDQIWLGVECKNTGYEKGLLKEILGIRRELSLLTDWQPTKFARWPRASVRATPPSCLLVYSTDEDVADYSAPGNTFGIDFIHEAM
jgi:hypothetical protein